MRVNVRDQSSDYPGTPLRDSDIKEGRVITVHDAPHARYTWDAGVAMGKFFAELKAGRLMARRCRQCDRILMPPRMFCEMCFRPTDEWVPVLDTGKVNTFSICYVRWDATRIAEPQIPAVVEIDGASAGMGILHLLGEVDPSQVKIGMSVRAVWKPVAERQGAITDIQYFKPV